MAMSSRTPVISQGGRLTPQVTVQPSSAPVGSIGTPLPIMSVPAQPQSAPVVIPATPNFSPFPSSQPVPLVPMTPASPFPQVGVSSMPVVMPGFSPAPQSAPTVSSARTPGIPSSPSTTPVQVMMTPTTPQVPVVVTPQAQFQQISPFQSAIPASVTQTPVQVPSPTLPSDIQVVSTLASQVPSASPVQIIPSTLPSPLQQTPVVVPITLSPRQQSPLASAQNIPVPSPQATPSVQVLPIGGSNISAANTPTVSPVSVKLSSTPVIQASPFAATPMPSYRAETPASPTRVTVMSTSPSAASTQLGVAEENTLSTELLKYGFIVNENIVDKSKGTVDYVVVETLYGNTIFVQIDDPKALQVVASDEEKVSYREDKLSIPVSYKVGADACVGNAVCGVAFKCDGGSCVRMHEADGQTKREVSYLVEDEHETTITPGPTGSIFSYPVMKLSYIRADPKAAMRTAAAASNRLHADATSLTIKRSEMSDASLRNIGALAGTVSSFNKKTVDFLRKVSSSYENLEKWSERWEQLEKAVTLTPEDSAKMKDVYLTMRHRHRIFREAVAMMEDISSRVSALEKESQSIADNIPKYLTEIERIENNMDVIPRE